jgi:thioredoxin reductase (NADPH)
MEQTDILIVGAGPIGIELALHLKKLGRDYLHVEASCVGRTLQDLWPPNTRFLSGPDEIALPGFPLDDPGQDRPTAEEYLAYLRRIIRGQGLAIRQYETVTDIEPGGQGFTVTTRRAGGPGGIECNRVVLATGDMHRPRRLHVPGEDLPHVLHGLGDPHRLFDRDVLVIGGLNSAVEAAIRLHRVGTRVTLSYRRERLDAARISHKLYPVLQTLIDKGQVEFLPRTAVVEFTPDGAEMAPTGEDHDPLAAGRFHLRADFALVLIGFEADIELPRRAGVTFATPTSPPKLNPDTMETNVAGLYIAGTAAAGNTYGHVHFIETAHPHVQRIIRHLQETS